MSDFHRTQTQRARRPHRCDTCNRPLTVGALYAHHSGVYDGSWYSWRQHLACQALTRAWSRKTNKDWEDQPAPGDARAFIEDLGETLCEMEGTAARIGGALARLRGDPEPTPTHALRRAALGWAAILEELPDGADPDDVAYLRGIYVENAGCPDCGTPKYDRCACGPTRTSAAAQGAA